MQSEISPLEQKGLAGVLKLLRNKFPVAKYNYYQNLTFLETLTKELYKEVKRHYLSFPEKKRTRYFQLLLNEFSSLEFEYDSRFIDMKLKKYGEDYTSFPEFQTPIIRERLQFQLCSVRSSDVNPDTISDFVIIKQLQTDFLNFAFEMKVREIIEFIRKTAELGVADKNQNTPSPSGIQTSEGAIHRQQEKILYREMKCYLQYQDSDTLELISSTNIRAQLKKGLLILQEVTFEAREEIYDNLLLLPLQNSIAYLKRVLSEITRLIIQFEKREIHLKNYNEDFFTDPTQEILVENRRDIYNAMREFNRQKVTHLSNLSQHIEERLQDYYDIARNKFEISNASSLTTNQFIMFLGRLMFFNTQVTEVLPNTDKAELAAFVMNRNAKNTKTCIEKMETNAKEQGIQYQADEKIVDDLYNRLLKKGKYKK